MDTLNSVSYAFAMLGYKHENFFFIYSVCVYECAQIYSGCYCSLPLSDYNTFD